MHPNSSVWGVKLGPMYRVDKLKVGIMLSWTKRPKTNPSWSLVFAVSVVGLIAHCLSYPTQFLLRVKIFEHVSRSISHPMLLFSGEIWTYKECKKKMAMIVIVTVCVDFFAPTSTTNMFGCPFVPLLPCLRGKPSMRCISTRSGEWDA